MNLNKCKNPLSFLLLLIVYPTSDPFDLRDYVNGYKHIVKTTNGFSDQIVKFSDNISKLDALIRIVSPLSKT